MRPQPWAAHAQTLSQVPRLKGSPSTSHSSGPFSPGLPSKEGTVGDRDEHGSNLIKLIGFALGKIVNDPSAGSPTETLLRLLLPLNDQV